LELSLFEFEIDGKEYTVIVTTTTVTRSVYPRAREETAKPAQHSRVATPRHVKWQRRGKTNH